MFDFLENAEIAKEKKKRRKKEYGKELRLQIEQNRLKKLGDKKQIQKEDSRENRLYLNEDKSFFPKRNNNSIKNLDKLKDSIDNILMKYKLRNKFSSSKNEIFGNDKNIKNNFENFRFVTENNYNNILRSKSRIFNINKEKDIENYNCTDNNITSKQKNQHFMKKSLSQMIKSIPIQHNNLAKSHIKLDNKNLMEEIDIQFLFKRFVEQQIRTINEYSTQIENIFYLNYKIKEKNILLFNSLIKNEKNKAIETIKNEKNKLKEKFGFFPLEKIYDYRIEQLFNKILNKIISIYSSINQTKINNFINIYDSNNNNEICILKGKTDFSKMSKINNDVYSLNRINLDDDLNFFDFWEDKFKNEIMNKKNKILNVNETININNIKSIINNKNENNLNILPANNFFKNVKLKQFKEKNKDKIKELKLPDICLKDRLFKLRNKSACNKNYECFFK